MVNKSRYFFSVAEYMGSRAYLYLRNKNMRLFLSPDHYVDTARPIDISIPIVNGSENLRAWYVDPPKMEPVRANGFVGSVVEGGAVNFRDIYFNPHGHGTHTECLGHITEEVYSINETLRSFICKAQLVTLEPVTIWNETYDEEDLVILKDQFDRIAFEKDIDALVIRTTPNPKSKKHFNYSATNPPYLHENVYEVIQRLGIKHLLIDLPSVDRESDGGVLSFHHLFWGVPEAPDHEKTITELIYVPDNVNDGIYLLELQVAAFENDASPSRPVLYQIATV
jgi:arylformamidase